MATSAKRLLSGAVVVATLCGGVYGTLLFAQARGGTPQTDKVTPVNSGANPYRVIRDWGKIEGRAWGGSNGVAIDKDGKTVWAVDRCSPGTTPGCANTNVNPVHHFDESGKEIKSFGGGMFAWPHGIHVDRDGNIWVADSRADEATHKGSVVVKFAPDGKVLMTLGKAGVKGNPPEALTEPTVGRQVPADDRQDRHRSRRIPHAARARLGFDGPDRRRRSPQSPRADPDEGWKVRSGVR